MKTTSQTKRKKKKKKTNKYIYKFQLAARITRVEKQIIALQDVLKRHIDFTDDIKLDLEDLMDEWYDTGEDGEG